MQKVLGYHRDEDMLPPVAVVIELCGDESNREGLRAAVGSRRQV